MTETLPSVVRGMARRSTWMVVLHLFSRSLGFASTLILARVSVPDDFDAVAQSMSVIAALAVFSEFSSDLALI